MKKMQIAAQACPICSGQDISFVLNHNDFPGTGIWFCSPCDYWFVYPEPDVLELNRYYKETYGAKRSRYFGEEYYVLMERRAKAQLRFIKRCLSQSGMWSDLRGWKTIDWGCGVGALVASLQHAGADAVGYDSDSEAIAVGQRRWKANVQVNTSYDLSRFYNQFDLLLLSHVVEHLPNIRETMRNLLKVLRLGGYVFIEVPNSSSEVFVAEMDPESHLHFFSRQSLTLLLTGLGVQVIACVSCGPPKVTAVGQEQTSKISHLAKRFVVGGKALLQSTGERVGIRAKHVRTIYDGFYEHYPSDETGLWLRYVGRT